MARIEFDPDPQVMALILCQKMTPEQLKTLSEYLRVFVKSEGLDVEE